MQLIKSVSGVRGLVRADRPEDITMNADVAFRMGRAFATHLHKQNRKSQPLKIIGARDGRTDGDKLLNAFILGVEASGVRAYNLGIVTTPGAAMMVMHEKADGGVVITASHNPAQWNGIKFMTPDGHAPSATDAAAIFKIFDSGDFLDGKPTDGDAPAVDPHEHHVSKVLAIVDADAIRARQFNVVLDSINGAGAIAGRMLLERLGCRITHINAAPADVFAHKPEPLAENLVDLCEHVKAEKADAGFAQDPDADRLAIFDETGRFIGEEYTLVLCAQRVLATHPGPSATNLSSSRMLDDVAAQIGQECVVHRSAVGEPNVVELMRERGCIIGGEGNGGIIDPRVVYVRDSLVGMALLLDQLVATGKTVSQLVADIPTYATVKDKTACAPDAIGRAIEAVKTAFPDGQHNDTDGLRIDWPEERKWLVVRGSNTEPIIRMMAEAPDRAVANQLIEKLREIIRETV